VIGLALARDLAVLAAEASVALPPDQVPDAQRGLDEGGPLAERWAHLREAVARHEEADRGVWAGFRALCGSRIAAWLATSCAACELHPEAAAAYSILAEDERLHLVTAAAFARVARTALGVDYAEALVEAATGAAMRLGIIEAVEGGGRAVPTTHLGLRLARAELGALGGRGGGAPSALVVRHVPPASGACFDERLIAGALAVLAECGALVLRGPSARGARQLAFELARVRGLPAAIVEIDGELPPMRELARVRDAVLVLDLSRAEAGPALDRTLELLAAAALVIAIVPARAETELPALDAPPLDLAAARAIWTEVAGAEDAEHLARRFRVTLDEARSATRDANRRARARGAERATPADLIASVRARGARRMGPAVSAIAPHARLSELVVPPAIRGQLEDIVAWYRAGDRGRAALGERGRGPFGWGLTCLFSGPPGTGKTFAAQCLAAELGLNLYRIDLAQVVSKYIGETEKALARVFAEAEAGHGILLFDEADALFGKRTEVKDAHDRYANVEVGYLLQRLEDFEGVGILTTNLRDNLDGAFVRRLRFVIEFPIPDQPWRRELWEQAIPRARAPELELAPFVERFRLPGGLIHNIGVAAAYLAAAGDGVVTPALLVRATYRELEKAGMPRSAAEFGPLAELLEGVAA
jgi:ATPase family associated with various cellular activities (AAA)